MLTAQPSHTALRAARRRAAHQVLDRPLVFDDPLALPIAGILDVEAFRSELAANASPVGAALRAFLAVRSRYAEDSLRDATARGVNQYVILGAGLDTFAYRRGERFRDLIIFEVDHPATQAWKRQRLAEERIAEPFNVRYVPIDFERESLADSLASSGFDKSAPAFFSWLGVIPYLERPSISRTLRFIASCAPLSAVVFDYSRRPDRLEGRQREVFERLAGAVAEAGEPWITFFEPEEIRDELTAIGFDRIEDLGADQLNKRYFSDPGGVRVLGALGRVLCASQTG